MNKMTKFWINLSILMVLLLTASVVSAQRYPYVLYGNLVTCREGFNGVKAALIHPRWSDTPAHRANDATNNRLGARFHVSARLQDSKGWYDAINYCSSYRENDALPDRWRLPTIRELALLYALKDELKYDYGSFIYWSRTVASDTGYPCCINMATGQVTNIDTGSKTYVAVLCVRDR